MTYRQWIRPQSFFQTNPAVASQLYATARDWVRQLPVKHMWDLFCGGWLWFTLRDA